MSIIKRIFTALRGGATEVGEAIVDSQALRILDQELRDASADQGKAKEALAGIMAKVTLSKKRIEEFDVAIADLTKKALLAQEKGNTPLAMEIAQLIGERTQQRDMEATQLSQSEAFAQKQRRIVEETDRRIKNARHQAETAASREAILKAQKSIMASSGESANGLNNAMDSLNRLRERQDMEEAQMEAREELHNDTTGKTLEKKMADAGLIDNQYSAEAILAGLTKESAPKA